MHHRTLSTGVESGSSFRMTQLLLPASADVSVHDSGASGRSHRAVENLLPQLNTSARTDDDDDDDARRLYQSRDNYSKNSWQTSIKLDTTDYEPFSRRYCSVYRNTSGQSLQLASFCPASAMRDLATSGLFNCLSHTGIGLLSPNEIVGPLYSLHRRVARGL